MERGGAVRARARWTVWSSTGVSRGETPRVEPLWGQISLAPGGPPRQVRPAATSGCA
ncbi:hypothetical protein FM119_09875 [Mycetocola reblochoni REB411]|uniref:Uncharacterized protein n=1 Tax=Mycetocola reblochoni REB411 TaxID=1255698 RepID=A0A1R4JWP5_9MICO|nr:hypothetical protein FM119_09875 [Mycetocola reblochoni REB411]